MILTNDEDLAKKVNSAVFPGMQGGPLMHIIAAKAVAFGEALPPEFSAYARAVVDNAEALGEVLELGFDLVSGGTDNAFAPGRSAAKEAHRQPGRERIEPRPHDDQQERRAVRSREADRDLGDSLGSPAGTTRGFGVAEFHTMNVGRRGARRPGRERRGGYAAVEARVKAEAIALCRRFPIYA